MHALIQRSSMEVSSVAVVGAGTMGASIAVALASHGFDVILKEVNEELLQKGIENIDRINQKREAKGMSAEALLAERNRITLTTSFDDFSEVDLAIEAVPEKIEIKEKVFRELDEYCNVNAILATNTSSLSISQIGAFTMRPDKVIGLHFFNPAHLMKLVEVIPGLETSEETVETCLELGRALGKLAVRVDECPSFLVNRLLGRYMNESLWCLSEGLATIEEIDKAAADYVVPIGPLALRDMNDADIGLAVCRCNHQEYGPRYAVPDILESMVERNLLGRKTGKGFYLYDPDTRKKTGPNPEIDEFIKGKKKKSKVKKMDFKVEQLFLPMINEAFLALQERVCNPQDLDPALMAGLGMRRGPLRLAHDIGLPECLSMIEQNFELYGERYRPAPLLKRFVHARKDLLI